MKLLKILPGTCLLLAVAVMQPQVVSHAPKWAQRVVPQTFSASST
jgi:hypothetical protein